MLFATPNIPSEKPRIVQKKLQKNRYERRKIKEYLHLGDWVAEQAT